MRALVTGCAGFIGSHLTESLLDDGVDVLGIDCFNDNYGRAEKLENLRLAQSWDAFEFLPLDMSHGELEDVVAECDVIFHLAAEPGVRPSWGRRFEKYLRNNMLATQHLLEALSRQPGRRVVYASSSSIYGQAERMPTPEDVTPHPRSPYGITKLGAEHLCGAYQASHGVDTVALRYFSVYGPRQRPDMAFRRFCDAVLAERPLQVFGDGGQTRDVTFVGDVVAATRAAAEAPQASGLHLNVGGGSAVSVNEAIEIVQRIAGRSFEVDRLEPAPGEIRDTTADISLARSSLGYEPRTSVEEGLAAQWEWSMSRTSRSGVA
jgi:UDP-glucuronate 4-epimerase